VQAGAARAREGRAERGRLEEQLARCAEERASLLAEHSLAKAEMLTTISTLRIETQYLSHQVRCGQGQAWPEQSPPGSARKQG
jgi:hypothetical protein